MTNDYPSSPGERAAFANGFEAGQQAKEPKVAEPYLILHKVRGEPAFDIAVQIQIGDEEGWIIPTSGHRAYPMARWQLEDLADISDYPHERPIQVKVTTDLATWPDHYHCNNPHDPPKPTIVNNLLQRLGLVQKVNRRI